MVIIQSILIKQNFMHVNIRLFVLRSIDLLHLQSRIVPVRKFLFYEQYDFCKNFYFFYRYRDVVNNGPRGSGKVSSVHMSWVFFTKKKKKWFRPVHIVLSKEFELDLIQFTIALL